MRGRAWGWRGGALVLVLMLMASCSQGGPDGHDLPADASATESARTPAPETAGPASSAATELLEYRPGMTAEVALPAQGEPSAVVVLVPGGSWTTADPTGIRLLATALTQQGLATVTITYGTWSTQDLYPVPVQDVACALGLAADRVPQVPRVVLGHSAGAHLAVLAALAPQLGDDGGDGCGFAPEPADAAVGLAGPYDVAATFGMATRLFGVPRDEDTATWTEGNPLTWAQERPEVPFLLVHGDADRVVDVTFTTDLAEALTAGGHPTAVEVLGGVDHSEVYDPAVVADLVTTWVAGTVVTGP